jgi:hypothetical protein
MGIFDTSNINVHIYRSTFQIQTYICTDRYIKIYFLKSQRDLRVEEAKSACAASRASSTFLLRSTSSFDKTCVCCKRVGEVQRARARERGEREWESEKERGAHKRGK